MTPRPPRSVLDFVPAVCVGLLLLFTFRLFTTSYFWLDDFANLYWVQQRSFGEALWLVVSLSAEHFRPVGMFVYWPRYSSSIETLCRITS